MWCFFLFHDHKLSNRFAIQVHNHFSIDCNTQWNQEEIRIGLSDICKADKGLTTFPVRRKKLCKMIY